MGFELTVQTKDPRYKFDYLGLGFDLFRYSYFLYKVYHREPFHLYDATWLFVRIRLQIPA